MTRGEETRNEVLRTLTAPAPTRSPRPEKEHCIARFEHASDIGHRLRFPPVRRATWTGPT